MNGTAITSTSTTQLIDDFLRKELRVGDPRNATEVATALRARYQADAARIDQEGAGMAPVFVPTGVPPAPPAAGAVLSSLEAQRAHDDLEADFQTVATEPANRLRQAELTGWKTVIVDEWIDARAAALLSADPVQRDRVFYAIRHLSDFARVSRMAAVSYPEIAFSYRRLAASLDAAGNVLRAMAGEALYNAGLSQGGLLLSMAVGDLRARRDGLIHAVRLLTGVEREDETWPDALVSYRELRDAITAERRPELMIYLREESLTPILDDLLAEGARNDGKALRGLAATGLVDVNRFRELLELLSRVTVTPSSALARLTENLRLLLQFFGVDPALGPSSSRSGARLIELAMPIPLITLSSSLDDAPQRRQLAALVSWRHALQAEVDGNAQAMNAPAQILADQAIYLADRAVDAFAMGQGGLGGAVWEEEELRAGQYLFLTDRTLSQAPPVGVAGVLPPAANLVADLQRIFPVPAATTPPNRPAPGTVGPLVDAEIARSQAAWIEMVRSLAPR